MEKIFQLYTGRLGRMQYFILNTLAVLPIMILFFPFGSIGSETPVVALGFAGQALIFVYGALTMWHLEVRRLHDIGRSGWWLPVIVLVGFIPLVGGIVSAIIGLLLLFWPGTDGENEYGPPPQKSRGLLAAYLNR